MGPFIVKPLIYARQSIEKEDSISIDTQVSAGTAICLANGWDDYEIFKDVGYSGSNMNRPDFQRALEKIKRGERNHIIVYRLDRISRSILDFSLLLKLLDEHDASFQSATEQLDTSTPMGRAMAHIVMVFAQLERETIAARIKDNYFFRTKKGHYPGGGAPYGYKQTKIIYEGKKATTLEYDLAQNPIVKRMYNECFFLKYSLMRIATGLNNDGYRTRTGKPWSSFSVRTVLRNPLYARNTIDMYDYFMSLGAIIVNEPHEFDGKHGLLLIGKEEGGKKNRRKKDISEQYLIIGLHPPTVESDQWLGVQYILSKNKQTKRSGTGNISWLTGLLKCAHCGYAMKVKVYPRSNGGKYYYMMCSGHANMGNTVCDCKEMHPLVEIEKEIESRLLDHISLIDTDGISIYQEPEVAATFNSLRAQEADIIQQIDTLINKAIGGAAAQYVQEKIGRLHEKRLEIQRKLAELSSANPLKNEHQIRNAVNSIRNNWTSLDVRDKHRFSEIIIDQITISKEKNIDITWYI